MSAHLLLTLVVVSFLREDIDAFIPTSQIIFGASKPRNDFVLLQCSPRNFEKCENVNPTQKASQLVSNIQRGVDIFCKGSVVNILAAVTSSSVTNANTDLSEFKLPELPYPYEGLEPFISKKTLLYHHDKHHGKYVSTLNSLIKGTSFEGLDLASVLKKAYKVDMAIFNNAAQSWNHAFYWNCMKPSSLRAVEPSTALSAAITSSFGSVEEFKKQFKAAGLGTFGSGWAWLVLEKGQLKVTKTSGADNPLVVGQTPLLTMDVWEHAYYLDYQNERNRYEDAFVDHLLDWDFVTKQFEVATGVSA